jgi:membrane fusion protein (multidrug efflux system)
MFRFSGPLLAMTIALVPACSRGGDGKPPAMPPVFVETEVVKPANIRDVAQLVGQLEAEESVAIQPEIEGIVDEILFEEGARAEKGAVLVRLRGADQAADLAAATARERLAADTFRRFHQLGEEQVTSKWEIERVTRELDVARAERERAQVRLEKTRLKAPFAGSLGSRRVSPGEWVSTETVIVEVHATERLRLRFALPERYAPLARVGNRVEVNVAAYPDVWFPGEVYFVDPAVDQASRQLTLKGWVQNREQRLRPGQFATIRAEVDRRDAALVVPDSALVYDGQASFVWKVGAERKAERADVETGIREQGNIEIRRGIASGDEIVVAGTNKVFPGATVMTSPPPAASGHAESAKGS